jgi:chromatin modification-related protein EAF6
MAENAPPPTTTPAAPADSSRGMPYYEKLRKDLRDALQKKRILDQNLASRPYPPLSHSR